MNFKGLRTFLFLILCLWVSGPALAAYGEGNCDDYHLHIDAKSKHYGVRAPARFMNGLLNASFGWTQFLIEPVRSLDTEDEDIFTALGDGFASTVLFTVGGLWDVATFWMPGIAGEEFALGDSVFCHMTA